MEEPAVAEAPPEPLPPAAEAPPEPPPPPRRRSGLLIGIVGLLLLVLIAAVAIWALAVSPNGAPPVPSPTPVIAVLLPASPTAAPATATLPATVTLPATATLPATPAEPLPGTAVMTATAALSSTATASVPAGASATMVLTGTAGVTATVTLSGTATALPATAIAGVPETPVLTATAVLSGTAVPATAVAGLPPTATVALSGTATTVLSGTATAAAAAGLPSAVTTGGPAPGGTGIQVVDSTGPAYACAQAAGCDQAAASGATIVPGGEARTGAAGGLRLQTPAGLVILAADTTVRLATVDSTQVVITLQQGTALVRAAAGRTAQLTVNAGPATVSGTGSTYAVALQSNGDVQVTVPAESAHLAHVTAPAGAQNADLSPGTQATVAAEGALGPAVPVDAATAAALATLGGVPPAGTPAAAAITALVVPTPPPFPAGAVTATMVLSPPPGTPALPPPSTAVAQAPSATVPPGTPAPPAATATPLVIPSPRSVADWFAAGAAAMGGASAYTFGAAQGLPPAAQEFSAGTVADGTACWIATINGAQTDFQVRDGVMYRRTPGGAWQQQSGTAGLPAWLTYWHLLGQVDLTSAQDLGAEARDAVTVHHLRARLQPAPGFAADTWIEAYVGASDYRVRALVLWNGPPATGQAFFRIGYSSFGAPLGCPPLNAP